MIYFRKNGEVIEKYQISFDKEKIEDLNEEIINNCSYIKHEEYESDYWPKFTDEIIRNFKYIRTGKVKRYFDETRDIYQYSYEEYKPPYLVTLINQFLDGNPDAIDRILKYDISITSNIDDKAQQSMELYYNQLIGLISFNLIDSLSISELSRIESFLEIELANKVVGNDSKEKSVVKLLKKYS